MARAGEARLELLGRVHVADSDWTQGPGPLLAVADELRFDLSVVPRLLDLGGTLRMVILELQSQAADRRRAIEEIADRLRQREHALTEQVDNAESEARARLEIASAELERRQAEQLERALAREVDRLSEAGALEFENRMRAIREEAADRLQSELDRMSETFLRRADALISSQFQHVADVASQRLSERIAENARRYESSRAAGGD